MKQQQSGKLNWGIYSELRAELMGFSIFLIVIFHGAENYNILLGYTPAPLRYLVYAGMTGVEMFLLLSGIGLYFSYTRNRDLKIFYWKRFTSILIPYFLLAIPYLLWFNFIYRNSGFVSFLKDLFMLTAFKSRNRQCWYVALILVLYVFFPLFYRILERGKTVGFLVLETAFIALPLLLEYTAPAVFSDYQIALTRIPAFILGIFCGRLVMEKRNIKWWPVLLVAAILLLRYVYYRQLEAGLPAVTWSRFYRGAFAMLVLLLVALLLKVLPVCRLHRFLLFLSPFTLELYVSHVELRRMMMYLFKTGWTAVNVPLAYIGMLVIAVPLSYWVHRLTVRILGKLPLPTGKKRA